MADQDLTKRRLQESVDAVLDKAIGEKRIVGAVVLASLAGRRIYQRAAGFADREARTPVHLNTVFRWSSLTKTVVATAALALVERGLISLDDPVTRFLPGFRPSLPNGETPIVTVRHLITHTARRNAWTVSGRSAQRDLCVDRRRSFRLTRNGSHLRHAI
jgi:CubicO group peptidase (beta-lactamase class C family)